MLQILEHEDRRDLGAIGVGLDRKVPSGKVVATGETDQEHEVVKAIPDECVSERIVEQIARSVLVERINDRTADQMVDIPVPLVMEEIMAVVQEVVRLFPQTRVRRIDEHCGGACSTNY